MKIKSIDLCWVTTTSYEKAKKFFLDVGLKLDEASPEIGWLEFSGNNGGSKLGIMQKSLYSQDPGTNAIVTLKIDDINKTKTELEKNGVRFLGDIVEIPGHVKLALFTDFDGNKFQLVEEFPK